MKKPRKLSISGPSLDDDYWDSLERRRKAQIIELRRTQRRARESAQPGLATKRLTERAAWGTREQPTGPGFTSRITIDPSLWAGWIVELAAAWRIFPGVKALRLRPVAGVGLGTDAGRKIFNRALAGATNSEVSRAITRAKKALGAWTEGEGRASESEAGVLGYFRQLDKDFDGSEWGSPGRQRRYRISAVGSDQPRMMSEAKLYWVRHRDLAKELSVDGQPWYMRARKKPARHFAVPPESRMQSGRGSGAWYRLGSLLQVFEQRAGKDLAGRTFNKGFLRKIKPADWKPSVSRRGPF